MRYPRRAVVRAVVKAVQIPFILLLASASALSLTFGQAQAQVLTQHDPITISGDLGFTTCGCVTMGNGSRQTPYVIEGWSINASGTHGVHVRRTQLFFVIRNVAVSGGYTHAGIFLENIANGIIENTTITHSLYGIWITGSSNTVRGSNIHNNTHGLYLTGGSGNKIHTNQITNNTRNGIWISGSSSNTISANNASSNHSGFLVGGGSNNLFEQNHALNNSFYGFRILFTSGNVFRNNAVSENQFGMIFERNTYNLAMDNLATKNDYGMGLEGDNQNNTFTRNRILDNSYGVYSHRSSKNKIYDNYLQNTFNSYDDAASYGFKNNWNVSKNLSTNILGGPFVGGNYYSDYVGKDNDEDGIGDIPYTNISGGNSTHQSRDYLPLVQPRSSIVHDIAATGVTTTPASARAGQVLDITVSIFNEGTVPESFFVSITYNSTLLETRQITDMPEWSQTTINLPWNTFGLEAGTYKVRADASIVEGERDIADNISPSAFVTILQNRPPTASFIFSPQDPLINRPISFDASTSHDPESDPIEYFWDFGDETYGSGINPTHAYQSAGTYIVTLTVKDDLQETNSSTTTVRVSGLPPGPPGNPSITAGNGEAILRWAAPSTNGGLPITGYRIYRGTDPASLNLLTTIGNLTNYRDTSVVDGQTYFYKVSAVNEAGEGPKSNEADVLVPLPPSSRTAGPDYPMQWVALAGIGVLIIGSLAYVFRRGKMAPKAKSSVTP